MVETKIVEVLNRLEIALFYADPPHPMAAKLLDESWEFLKEQKKKSGCLLDGQEYKESPDG